MNFGDRRDCHIASLRGGYHINPHLQAAWDKFGEDCFEFFVIRECTDADSRDDINKYECEEIAKYKSAGLAYNISDGGDGGQLLGKHLSEDAKSKIGAKNRLHMTGRKASDVTRKKMSESQRARYASMTDDERKKLCEDISKYASGYKWSSDARERFSELQRTKPNGAKYNPEIVRSIRKMYEQDHLSISEISKILDIHRHTVYQIATYRRWKNVQ